MTAPTGFFPTSMFEIDSGSALGPSPDTAGAGGSTGVPDKTNQGGYEGSTGNPGASYDYGSSQFSMGDPSPISSGEIPDAFSAGLLVGCTHQPPPPNTPGKKAQTEKKIPPETKVQKDPEKKRPGCPLPFAGTEYSFVFQDNLETKYLLYAIHDRLRSYPISASPPKNKEGISKVLEAELPFNTSPKSPKFNFNISSSTSKGEETGNFFDFNIVVDSHCKLNFEGHKLRDGLTLSSLYYGRINRDDITDFFLGFSNSSSIVIFSGKKGTQASTEVYQNNLNGYLLDLALQGKDFALPLPGARDRVFELLNLESDRDLLRQYQELPPWAQGLIELQAYHPANDPDTIRAAIREAVSFLLSFLTLPSSKSGREVKLKGVADRWRVFIQSIEKRLPANLLTEKNRSYVPERVFKIWGKVGSSTEHNLNTLGNTLQLILLISLYSQISASFIPDFLNHLVQNQNLASSEAEGISQRWVGIPATLSIVSQEKFDQICGENAWACHNSKNRIITFPETPLPFKDMLSTSTHEQVHQLVEIGHVKNGLNNVQGRLDGKIVSIPSWMDEGLTEDITETFHSRYYGYKEYNYSYPDYVETLWLLAKRFNDSDQAYRILNAAHISGNYDPLAALIGEKNLRRLLGMNHWEDAADFIERMPLGKPASP